MVGNRLGSLVDLDGLASLAGEPHVFTGGTDGLIEERLPVFLFYPFVSIGWSYRVYFVLLYGC